MVTFTVILTADMDIVRGHKKITKLRACGRDDVEFNLLRPRRIENRDEKSANDRDEQGEDAYCRRIEFIQSDRRSY